MATALPVVATRVGGNAELVDDGATGALVPASDVEALALAIVRYAAEREIARAQGQAGRRRVEHKFSIDAMAGNYSALYQDALVDALAKKGIGASAIRTADSPELVTASAPESTAAPAANANQPQAHPL
jgi:hypothetical protein